MISSKEKVFGMVAFPSGEAVREETVTSTVRRHGAAGDVGHGEHAPPGAGKTLETGRDTPGAASDGFVFFGSADNHGDLRESCWKWHEDQTAVTGSSPISNPCAKLNAAWMPCNSSGLFLGAAMLFMGLSTALSHS
ncbi:hypothetical protein [uncultured Desulfovibrio sp.]|uniref:hypothetical protein n=1 Tax=uncultured Desulfovibrio sp. TaxID=167968 RepID=UPI00258323E6|nr:hypothetical protein [uncultured Desulfovibrio sp.]